jgi:DNA-binding transcriptional MerR regulator
MMRIGQFSRMTQVSTRTLRYYDELGLLKPEVIDPHTGYRYYTFDQIPRLNRILALKDLAFDLQQIAHLLDTEVTHHVLRGYLLQQENDLQHRIEADQVRLQRVRARLAEIEHEQDPVLLDVMLKSLDRQVIAGNRMIIPQINDIHFFAGHMYTELYRWLRQHHIPYSSTQLIIYHAEEFVEQDYDMEVAVLLPLMPNQIPQPPHTAIRIFELAATPLVASTVHHGRLREADHTVRELLRWSDQHGYTPMTEHNFMREIHYFEPTDQGNPIPLKG